METGTGVYFLKQDYAGVWRQLFVDAVDSLTVISACAALAAAIWNSISNNALLAVWAAVFFSYFVLLKRSRFRTVGRRLAAVRIVGLDGGRPSIPALSLRLIFMALGPLNYLVDVLFVSSDANRQALRDKFAHTYVVKKDATPSGTGKVMFRRYEIFGNNFLFREIAPGADGEAAK